MLITETERLSICHIASTDAPFLLELVNSAGWLQFIGDRNVHTLPQAQFYIENSYLKSYQKNGFGMYLVKRKEDQAYLGVCGLVQRDYFTGPDIGYAFLPNHTGQGYAFEAAQAVMEFANHDLQIQELLAITVPGNEKSIKLLKKLGFLFKEHIKDPSTQEDLNLYWAHLTDLKA